MFLKKKAPTPPPIEMNISSIMKPILSSLNKGRSIARNSEADIVNVKPICLISVGYISKVVMCRMLNYIIKAALYV